MSEDVNNILPILQKNYEGKHLTITLGGNWLDTNAEVFSREKENFILELKNASCNTLSIDASKLSRWDVTFLAFVLHILQIIKRQKIEFSLISFPDKAERLIMLALEVEPKTRRKIIRIKKGFFESIWLITLASFPLFKRIWHFTHSLYMAFVRLWQGKSFMLKKDLYQCFQDCGINALPIIALTSTLLGLILAFTGSIQFAMVGAEVYTAPFVSISMLRIMGALLTGIILAGRTGASFAALIGTMQVNEEIDALETFAIPPYDFLVLPRVIALTIMAPILTLYSNIMGIAGGFIIGIFLLGISPALYYENTLFYLESSFLWIGLFHGLVFGFIIAVVGCYQGMRCGRSAEAVGKVTTAAVVNSLVGIIVMTAILTLIFATFGY